MTVVCCNKCYESMNKIDASAARLWLDLCAYSIKFQGVFKLREERVPGVIRFFRQLEQHGYILTADGEEAVRVRVNGYGVINENEVLLDSFCLDREAHHEDWI